MLRDLLAVSIHVLSVSIVLCRIDFASIDLPTSPTNFGHISTFFFHFSLIPLIENAKNQVNGAAVNNAGPRKLKQLHGR